MSATFRPLADVLQTTPVLANPAQRSDDETGGVRDIDPFVAADAEPRLEHLSHALASLALARLAAHEAYERAAQRVVTALAADVLARELQLSCVDIDALVRRSLEAFAADEPVAVMVAPEDAERLSCELPVRIDRTLRHGDLVLVVRDGIVDLRLDVRLGFAVNEACS